MKKGHVPIRQCVGCRQRKEKAAQLRFAPRDDGQWQADPGNRLPGRGAYLCSAACVERVKKNKRYRNLAMTAQTIAASAWPTVTTPA